MAVSSITLGTGNDTSAPNGTKVPGVTSNQGLVTGVSLGYVDGSSDFQPLGGATGIPVEGTTTLSGLTVASTNAPVHVAGSTSSVELIAANASRKGWTIQNNSSANLRVKLGTAASSSSFHRLLTQGESMGHDVMSGGMYTGAIHGIWESATGFADGGDW